MRFTLNFMIDSTSQISFDTQTPILLIGLGLPFLETAISRRRAIFKYRDRYRRKLGKGLTSDEFDTVSTMLSDTTATEFEEGIGSFNDYSSDAGGSQTSYAQTLLQTGGEQNGIPSPPKEVAEQKPFECPYCKFIITVKSSSSWARHIFRDLMPYLCLYGDCKKPDKLYPTRHEWIHHLITEHHLGSTSPEEYACPLCKEVLIPKYFEKHLARHLEELSLFALPTIGFDEGSSKGSNTQKNLAVHENDSQDNANWDVDPWGF